MTTTVEPLGAAVDSDAVPGDVPVLRFSEGVPGFSDQHRFALVELDASGLLFDLQSLDDPTVRFVVVPSVAFFPGYAPEISELAAARLALQSADDAAVLLVVKIGADLAQTTANLRAPVVVNLRTQDAAQVVLDDPDLPLQAPLLPAAR